jgi:NAD-dependent deacetylase
MFIVTHRRVEPIMFAMSACVKLSAIRTPSSSSIDSVLRRPSDEQLGMRGWPRRSERGVAFGVGRGQNETMSRADLARFLHDARRAVVFTGAGISTESGIPDFRSPGGVWSRMKPITFREFVDVESKRREAWSRACSGAAGWTGRAPNGGHRAVARLVAGGKVAAVITQNVDDLHQRAGTPEAQVIELHGNASYATCLSCGERHELHDLRESFLETERPPQCKRCDGLVKTATISFGQPMPETAMRRAESQTLACDLFLVLGSSLSVYPAAGFPLLAKRNGARLAIVNRERTPLDAFADLVLRDEIGPAMTDVLDLIGSLASASGAQSEA